MSEDHSTIFALSSGAPPAAIAIVRISGPEAAPSLVALAGRLPRPRRATLMALHDGAGGLLDRALCLWFPGPRTATGEDLAELHLHGGRAVVAAVLAALGALPGCRAAAPGEFTRRAFANGRLDLLEAEGLADLLAAETEAERRRALSVAEGGLSRLIETWRSELLGISARLEAQLEFGEEDDAIAPDPGLGADLARVRDAMQAALDTPPAERLRDGVRVLLCGPPNSGKSSLLNALAGRPVAITSPAPGTTRDLVEAPITIGGVAMILIDSAGLRDTADPVESEGVALAREAMASADILLWLGDAADIPAAANVIAIRSKSDLLQCSIGNERRFAVSAVSGAGLDELRALLTERAHAMTAPRCDGIALTRQQRASVCAALAQVPSAGITDPLLATEDVRLALGELDRLVGRAGVEDMLDTLFSRFCLGK